MPFAAGPEGTIRIPVEATGEEKISDDIFNAFIKGLNAVTKSKNFETAFKNMIKGALKTMEVAFEASNKRIERQLNNMFKNVPKAAQSASTSAANSLNHMVPGGVEGAINRLIKQFDRLNAAVSKPPNLALERELGRVNRALTAATTEAARQQTAAANSALQQQAAATNSAAKKRVVAWQIMSRQLVLIERGIGKVISATFSTASKVVASFARGMVAALNGAARSAGAAFRGLGRVVSSAFSAMTRTISAFARGAGRGFSGIFNGFRNALRRQESDLSNSLARQSRQIQSFQQQSSRGLTGALARGGALAGGFGIGAFLAGGFQRAGDEERLQLTFTTLLNDAGKAETVLAELSQFARTTSFDFLEIAGSVAQLTAALGDVDEATALTKFLADVTALTGGTTESLGRVRLAMSQIASAGKLDAANLKQLNESLPGIPFAQILADAFFGGDQTAFAEARDAGDLGATISADAFFDAFTEGVNQRFPEVEGFAVRAAGTLSGLAANLGENMRIFGAQIIRLGEGPIKSFIDTANQGLNALGNFISGVQEQNNGPLAFDTGLFGGGQLGGTELVPLDEDMERLRQNIANVAKALGGLLALKGVVELFRFLGIATRFLLSPMGLLALAVGGAAAVFNKLLEVTPFLRENFKVLGDQIKPTLHEIGRLGKALFNLFFGDRGAKGGDSVFLKIGRAVQRFVQFIARGLVTIRTFAKLMADLLESGRGDIAFEVIRIRLKELTGTIANFLGGSDIETAAAQARGGNDFLNILETTFLGPFIRFFRGPFSDAVEGVGGFVGDIFNSIFGDPTGGTGQAGGLTAIEERMFGTKSEQDSIGTRILDVLEGTFLGPIVRFFRGPFADVVEGFGGFIADIKNAIFGEGGGGLGTRLADVLENTFLGPVVRFFRGPFADAVENVAGFVVDLFRSIVDGIQGFLTLIEPFTDAVGNFFQGLFGAGEGDVGIGDIWEGLKTSLGNITDKVAELLDPVFTAISDWFSDNFTIENLLAAGDFVLDFVYEIGNKVGEYLGDPAVIGAAIGTLAGLTLILANTLLGVFTGLLENSEQWGNIILLGINSALGGILPDSISDGGVLSIAIGAAIVTAIIAGVAIAGRTAFKAGGGGNVLAGGFSWGTLAVSVAGGIMSAIGREFKALWRGGRALFANDRGQVLTPGGENRTFNTIGQSIGGALIAGIGVGFAGFQIGQNVSGPGGLLLGILTGTVTGAAIGTAIAPGIGTAIGAVLGGALGGISTLFGQNAAAAKEAREEVDEYVRALQDLATQGTTEIVNTVVANLVEGGPSVIDFLDFSGFDAQTFVDDILGGDFSIEDTFLGQLEELTSGTRLTGDMLAVRDAYEQIRDAVARGETLDAGMIDNIVSSTPGASQALQNLFGDSEVLTDAFNRMDDEANELGAGIRLLGDNADLGGGGLQTVADAVSAINDALTRDDTPQMIADILNTPGVSSAEALDALKDAAQEVNDKIAAARDQFQGLLDDMLGRGEAETRDSLVTGIVADLPSIASGFTSIFEDQEIAVNVKLAQIDEQADDFRDQIADALSAGFESGAIDTQGEFRAFITDVRQQIIDAHLPQDVEDQLLGVVDEFSNADFQPAFEAMQDALTDKETLAETGRLIVAGMGDTVLGEMAGLGASAQTALVNSFNGAFEGDVGTEFFSGAQFAMGTNNAGDGGIGGGLSGMIGDSISANGSPITDALSGVIASFDDDAAGVSLNETLATGFDGSDALKNAVRDAITEGALLGVGSIDDIVFETNAFSNARAGGTTGESAPRSRRPNPKPVVGVTVEDKGVDDARKLVGEINAILIAGAVRALVAGQAIGQAITSGITAGGRDAASTAAAIALGATLAMGRFTVLAFLAGRSISQGLAAGIRQAGAEAAAAAVAVALRVIAITRSILGSHSPSLVFRDIGRDIGKGFIQGIKDSEGDMAQAIGDAISKAITAGAQRAALAVARAQVGQAIFDNLAPGILPGGATTTSIAQSRAALTQSIAGVLADLRSGASGLLGNDITQQLQEAGDALRGMVLDLRIGFEGTNREVQDAIDAQRKLAEFDQQRAFLERTRASGALGRAEFTAQLNELKSQLASGSLSQDAYNKKLAVLNKELASGKLNLDKFNEEMKELGSRPSPLTLSQADLIRSGATTLNTGTLAGQANAQTIGAALSTIRDFGAAALEAGTPLATVIAEMQRYRNELIRQATAQGFSVAGINQLVNAYGLSNAALAAFRANLVSLNTGTAAGAANVAKINDQLQAIRDYGSELIAAGFSTATVTAQLKTYRDQLVAQAKAFGFNAAQIDALVNQAGLSNAALAAFIKQLADFDREARNAEATAKAAAKAAADKAAAEAAAGQSPGVGAGALNRPVIENLTQNIHLPSGDPEANALTVMNRLAYGLR